MADNVPVDTVMVSTALDRLDKLNSDEYIVAFGPHGRQFLATPNGYSATQLPVRILSRLTASSVRKITWASYGSRPDSWFFALEMMDGTATFEVGAGIPAGLRHFIDRIESVPTLRSALRVQLGSNDSFVAWANTSWAGSRIPPPLEARLCQLSSSYMSNIVTKGSFKVALSQVTWHSDGSYYVGSQSSHFWSFESSIVREAWGRLWSAKSATPSPKELSELVHVALDPHAPVADAFAFFKKQHDAEEAPFAIRFHGDVVHTSQSLEAAPPVVFDDTRLQHMEQKHEKPKIFRWAICKRGGRAHASDTWELELKKNQKVKVLDERGGNWYIVEGQRGVVGWVHGSWLSFCGSRVHRDSRGTYAHFQEDMRRLLIPGQLREFPPLSDYMSVCSNPACESLKGNSQLGICVHDLQMLLEGSGRYCYEWLKEERIVWHPDKFARYCHADDKERLKSSAQEVFVLYGILMDMCTRHEEEEE